MPKGSSGSRDDMEHQPGQGISGVLSGAGAGMGMGMLVGMGMEMDANRRIRGGCGVLGAPQEERHGGDHEAEKPPGSPEILGQK